MNEMINKIILAGDKFTTEMNLRWPGVSFSACRSFTKSNTKVQHFKEKENLRFMYQNALGRDCFYTIGIIVRTKIYPEQQLLTNSLMNSTGPLLENLRNAKHTHLIERKFAVLIL